MTPAEAAKLLGHCAAFDNRTVGETAARAWATALRDVPFDPDTLDAVARYYGTEPRKDGERLWIQPHDIRTHRRAIRSERATGFLYEPPAGQLEDPAYLRRYRRQLDAVASGQQPAPTGRPALDGPPHPDVAERLAEIGRTVPGEDEGVRRPGPLGIECPKCHAPIGRPCRFPGATVRTGIGKERPTPHPARIRAVKGDTEPTETAEDIERRRRAALQALARLPDGYRPEPRDGFQRDRVERTDA